MTVDASRVEAERADPGRYSYYVHADYYARLVALIQSWPDDSAPADAALRAECEALLYREARLIDDGRFEDWLTLFADECLYWIPVTPGGGDPRREVTLAFDDRRRLSDRIYWLRTGLAYCQIPPSRTSRLIGNVEVFRGSDEHELRVRSSFALHEFRVGQPRTFAGWYGHLLRKQDGTWKIAVKQVNLIDSDHGHENLTLIF